MKHYDEKQMQENILYLEALSEQYPNIQSAAAEMINLHAILDLPKGTEHFLPIFTVSTRHSDIFSTTHRVQSEKKLTTFFQILSHPNSVPSLQR